MKITRLRLLGFKSFVEPTEILIEPGLTGIVGPNGCGKSNLLEALRWVMGEISYKSMRGSAMEDVIFAGSQHRPARNTAEVTLFIDNSVRTAPAEFNDSDALEVTRYIEREVGSAYRVNGKDARARDIRLLFEDAATGARSPALVRQGRIGEIVNAAPQERRRVLEDAAGIAGLHSRRHEAELRLKATEVNLERIGDLIGQISSQLEALKRQARQAQRYREISGKIHETEALQHHLHWVSACAHVEQEEAAFQAALSMVAQETRAEGEALRQQAEVAEKLQPLRDEEAARAAVLHRLSVERDALEREEARAKARQAELETRLAQASRDLAREEEHIVEAEGMLRRLEHEARRLEEAGSRDHEEPQLREGAALAAIGLAAAEGAFSAATEDLARARAEWRSVAAEHTELRQRIALLERQSGDIARELAKLEVLSGGDTDLAALKADLARLSGVVEALETELSASEAREEAARASEAQSRASAASVKLQVQELQTELATLLKMLKPTQRSEWPPIVDAVCISEGYEQAIGSGVGDDLDAASDEAAPAHWRVIAGEGDPQLPQGAFPLSQFVSAPPALKRRLAQIGVVDRASGKALQAKLRPGQRLVSTEGDLWRWDGYSVAAGAAPAAGVRLAERNRLESLKAEARAAEVRHQAAEADTAAADDRAHAAAEGTKALRQKVRQARDGLGRIRDAIAAAEHESLAQSKQLGALVEAESRTLVALDESRGALARVESVRLELVALSAFEEALERARGEAAENRSAYARAGAALEGFEREVRLRQERLEAINAEQDLWQKRIAKAREQIETLRAREAETRADLAALANLPAEIEQRRGRLLDTITLAERERSKAADHLALAEIELKRREKALREVQERLAAAREARARSGALLESARERRSETAHAIREQLDCAPEACLQLAGIKPGNALPDLAVVEGRLTKLRGNRERL
ncbi:MAG TPA: chromosome segregation SMC family protein, partial [Methyloceanibacter sp.]|nr:chromosome segregation SMC family protein [Methyloceanibacter sp.]